MTKTRLLAAILLMVGVISVLSGISIAQQESGSNTNSNATRNTNRQTASKTANANAGMSQTDRKFMATAAADNLLETEVGRLAAQNGMSDGVKQFGQRLVDDHSKANEELRQLAAMKGNFTLPTQLDAKQTAAVNKLTKLSGAEFDREFVKMMVKDHQKAVSLFQKQSMTNVGDPDVKAFASKTLPTLQEHLRMAQEMSRMTTGRGSNGGKTNAGASSTGGSTTGNSNMSGNMNSMNSNMGGNSNSKNRNSNSNGNSNRNTNNKNRTTP